MEIKEAARCMQRASPREQRACDHCGTPFMGRVSRPDRFCSARCRVAWHHRQAKETRAANEGGQT